jgi:AmiR/NasT family two-component response regulator
MALHEKTYLYCLDGHMNFTGDIRKRFSDNTRYLVSSVASQEEFIELLEKEKENRYCKIALIFVHEPEDRLESIEKLAVVVKSIDKKTGLVLLIPGEKTEAVKKAVRFNIDAYIPEGINTMLRVHNAVKKIMSEYNLMRLRKLRNLSLLILFIVVLISSIILLAVYMKFRGSI